MADITGRPALMTTFTFGKYRGKAVAEIAENDPAIYAGYSIISGQHEPGAAPDTQTLPRGIALTAAFPGNVPCARAMKKAYSSATPSYDLKRPDFPPCPESISVQSNKKMVIVVFSSTVSPPILPVPSIAPGIMQTGSHQHVGIGLRPHAVIGTVAFHIVIIGFILRISPLFKFTGGQRNSFIQHGGHHIDERHRAITPWNSSGRSFTATPISIPPHSPHASSEGEPSPSLGKQRVTDKIIVKVFFFFRIYRLHTIADPARRRRGRGRWRRQSRDLSRLSRLALKSASILSPYEP